MDNLISVMLQRKDVKEYQVVSVLEVISLSSEGEFLKPPETNVTNQKGTPSAFYTKFRLSW